MKRPWLKPAVIVAALMPLAALIIGAIRGRLGANPIAQAMNQLGLLALIMLIASLACTPIKIVTDAKWPIAIRKTLGLLAFFYVTLHFGVYLFVDQVADWSAIGRDILERKFIFVGFAGFMLLIPLALTSTSGMLKRLGARRWKRLHRLAYVVGVLGIVHFIWRVKIDVTEPLIYAAILGLLFAIRMAQAVSKRDVKPRAR